jgi:hypothetical protein
MELMLLRHFQRQVHLQCQAVLVGVHDFNGALVTGDVTNAWIAMQNILTAAANISKALWGSRGKHAKAREGLRTSLQVDDTSPLREVAMRNHFEHYDERLDHWWAKSERHNHMDMSIMPPNMVQGLDDTDAFRVFDPTTGDLIFWGERFNVNELAQEATRLLPIAAAEARKPHFEPPAPPGSPADSPSAPGGGE